MPPRHLEVVEEGLKRVPQLGRLRPGEGQEQVTDFGTITFDSHDPMMALRGARKRHLGAARRLASGRTRLDSAHGLHAIDGPVKRGHRVDS